MTNKISIVMYHYVRDFSVTNYPRINGLDIVSFENQLKYFKKNFNLISMEEMIYLNESNKALPENAMTLTFDDGYIDHFQYAFPILKKLKLTGAFYIPSKVIEDHLVLDVNKIHFLLASLDESFLVKEIFNFLDKMRIQNNLKSNEDYFNLYKDNGYHLDTPAVRFIKKMLQVGLPLDLRTNLVDELFKTYFDIPETEFSKLLYMSLENMHEMISEGMHIGSHAHSHVWLNSLNYDEQEIELKCSMDFLKKLKLKDNFTICYPYGAYNNETVEISQKLGFKAGLTTKVGLAELDPSKMLSLSRFDTNDFPKTFD